MIRITGAREGNLKNLSLDKMQKFCEDGIKIDKKMGL